MNSAENLAEMMKVLADPTRLRLLKLLSMCEMDQEEKRCCGDHDFYCVGACAKRLGVSQSAVSQHLRILRHAGLVRGVRQGKFMHYTVDEEELDNIRRMFTEVLNKKIAVK